ncbi:MAG: cytochrome c oxidase subunit II [Planctomycetota bacterium]
MKRAVRDLVSILGLAVLSSLSGCAQAKLPVDVSTHGGEIDHLWWLITWITGTAFFATELLLVYCIFKFRHKDGARAAHVHGHLRLELTWTTVTALILATLAVYQISAWRTAKMPDFDQIRRDGALEVQVFAKQFEWNFRYKDKEGEFTIASPPGELAIPVNRDIIFEMRSADVLHSLFMPQLRFKQDLVPGTRIFQWVKATRTTKQQREMLKDPDFKFEIACAELCGPNHRQMQGIVHILDQADFDARLAEWSRFAPPEIWEDGNWDEKGLSYSDLALKKRKAKADHPKSED